MSFENRTRCVARAGLIEMIGRDATEGDWGSPTTG